LWNGRENIKRGHTRKEPGQSRKAAIVEREGSRPYLKFNEAESVDARLPKLGGTRQPASFKHIKIKICMSWSAKYLNRKNESSDIYAK